jgi:guanylate kinase
MVRPGLFFVFSGPSGSGKTSINNALLAKDQQLCRSVSATTRAPRAGEVHKSSYYFFDKPDFIDAIDGGLFAEHAHVFDEYYGTLKAPLEQLRCDGKDVLLALDWQGASSIKKTYGEQSILIYILPPNISDLKKRLYHRGEDRPEIIEKRLKCAYTEIQHCVHYDYVLVNNDLEKAIDQAWSIIQSERCRCKNQGDLKTLLRHFDQPVPLI